jgi:hypothetical protein
MGPATTSPLVAVRSGAYHESMRAKWIALPAAIILVAVALWWWRRDDGKAAATPSTAKATSKAPRRDLRPPPPPPNTLPANHDPIIYQPSNAPPLTAKPGTAVMFAPMTEYKYDPEQIKAEELEYKRYRLRFKLADAAAECHEGGDQSEDIRLAYTMVVRGEILTLENVRVLESNLPDPSVEACIVASVKAMRSPAKGLPDLRQDNEAYLSLHDLYVRNRAAADAP